jgi:DNA-directed RNA polymerase subunit P
MAGYKCFNCGKEIKYDYLRKKIRCPYCGSKILFKTRDRPTKVKVI